MELHLEGTISEDGRLLVEIPPNTPAGRVKVTLEAAPTVDFEKRNRDLLAWLSELDKNPGQHRRSREEIDAEIQAQRDSWD